MQCVAPNVAVDYHQPGTLAEDRLVVSARLLADCEGRREEPVVLERGPDDSVRARWYDAGVPQQREYTLASSETTVEFPKLPQRWLPQGPELLPALLAAAQTAARDSVRYALNQMQLQGKTGQLVATDGRQLLIHSGFRFGWHDSVLVPALPVWGCKELRAAEAVSLGRTESHVFVRVGSWTFALAIDREGRFPNVADIVPAQTARRTTWTLTAPAAALLARSLPRLPGGNDHEQLVRVDLNLPVAVRARGVNDTALAELPLPDSQVNGPALRFCGNRQYLARALALGFTRFELVNADKPVVACDERRTYLWMPLAAKESLPRSSDVVRIGATMANGESAAATERRATVSRPGMASTTTHDANEMPATRNGAVVPVNGHGSRLAVSTVEARGPSALQPGPAAAQAGLLQEAEALRDLLRDGYLRSQRLLAGLKRQRQLSRLLSSTVSALRQLKFVDP